MDLADPAGIARVIREPRPDLIINPAAYTAVDKAESEEVLARSINGEAPRILIDPLGKVPLPSETYHAVCSGEVSWHGFALAIFAEARQRRLPLKVRDVIPIPSADFPTLGKGLGGVPRSLNSG